MTDSTALVERWDVWLDGFDSLRTTQEPDGDWVRYSDHAVALTAAQAEIAELKRERLREDEMLDYWQNVIGDTDYTPAVITSVRHIHPNHVKPVFDANIGTEIADVIAGLVFAMNVAANRAKFMGEALLDARSCAEDDWTNPDELDRLSALSTGGVGWQSMDTAPKDGTLVLLGWHGEAGDIAIAGWYEKAPADRCWYDITHEPVTPEYWQPLNSLPALSGDA